MSISPQFVCLFKCLCRSGKQKNKHTHTCIPQIRCLSAKVYNYMIQLIAKRTSKRSQAASFVRGQETECWNSPPVSRKHGRRKLVDLGLASQGQLWIGEPYPSPFYVGLRGPGLSIGPTNSFWREECTLGDGITSNFCSSIDGFALCMRNINFCLFRFTCDAACWFLNKKTTRYDQPSINHL